MYEARNVSSEMPARNGLEAIEQRVHQLEDAVAALQNTSQLEDRLVERVTERIRHNAPVAQHPAAMVVEGHRPLVPRALEWVRSQAGPVAGAPGVARQSWLVIDAVTEARAMLHMFFDPRYRLGWGVRGLTLGLLTLILLTGWIPGTGLPVVGFLLNKVLDLVLAFILYKILSRESRRYRATFPDLFPPPRA
jgi:hypothetical protein